MFLLAVLAAVATLPAQPQAQATMRVVRAQRIDRDEWRRSTRKREIVLHEGGRTMTLRLIEFE